MKKILFVFWVGLCLNMFFGCHNTTTPNTPTDSFSWNSEPSGTLKIVNNTSKDMVVFHGETLNANTVIGGIKNLCRGIQTEIGIREL